MFEDVKELINANRISQARELINSISKEQQETPEFWILNASVYHEERLSEHEYASISIGLSKDPYNYELYYMLAGYYGERNANQAFLCYEQALFYCDNEEDAAFIFSEMKAFQQTGLVGVRPVSFIILSYNAMDIMKLCIESIRNTCPENAYELVVVDNASTDGISDWLAEQPDITLIQNKENSDFAKACNQGILAASPDNDIFILKNDTILSENSLFWLRMGLYERTTVGAVGPLTNCAANHQRIFTEDNSIEGFLKIARHIQIPDRNPYENKFWLVDFAMLIKREIVNLVGLLDEDFKFGNYEDNDYGVRITRAGFELLLCHNSFIYHFGSVGVNQYQEEYYNALYKSYQYFIEKWGFSPEYYSNIRDSLITLLQAEQEDSIQVLEIGCGCGSTLSQIKYLYPNAGVYGVELVKEAADCGIYMANILIGDVENMTFPYEENQFDYMIMGDVLEHLRNPEAVIGKLKKYLKPDGKIIASIPNLMNISVIVPLLQGAFTYQDAGLLDRTHIHFFTKKEIEQMFARLHFQIEYMEYTVNEEVEKGLDQELVNAVLALPGIADSEQFKAFQYIVIAKADNEII